MNWLERFSLVMRSSITVMCERIEQPDRLIHQLLIDMDEELERVRRSVAEAMADEIQLRKRVDAARQEADQWLARAKSAIDRKDESSAEAALKQKLYATERADTLTQEHERQLSQTRKLRDSVRDLEEKIRQARQRETLLLARLTRADSSQRINAALDRAHGKSVLAEFTRLETRVERAEALADAYDLLDGRDPEVEDLERRFNEEQRSEKIQQELESLRKGTVTTENAPSC